MHKIFGIVIFGGAAMIPFAFLIKRLALVGLTIMAAGAIAEIVRYGIYPDLELDRSNRRRGKILEMLFDFAARAEKEGQHGMFKKIIKWAEEWSGPSRGIEKDP